MTRYAVPGPPVQLPHGHVSAAGVPQHRGVAVGAVIDDAQPAAGPQDPCCLAQRLCAPAGFPDVGDRQAADHHVERRGREREVTRVRVDKLHPAGHALGRRVALSGGAAVAALVAAAPHVRSDRPAGGQAAGRKHQHRAAAASHIQDLLIAAQAQLIQQLRPDRALARPGGVQVTRRRPRHRRAAHASQRGNGRPAMAHRPGHSARQPRLHHSEHRQPGEPAVDAVPAPLPGATIAAGGRDLRDWLHAASLPATMTGEAVLHELSGIRRARPVRSRLPGVPGAPGLPGPCPAPWPPAL